VDVGEILIGLILAVVFWKLLKVTFKSFLWVLGIGLLVAVFFPEQLPLVGDLGVTVLSFLGSLLVLTAAGFFFFTGD